MKNHEKMYLFVFLISIIVLSTTEDIRCSYNPMRFVFNLSDGPIDIITKHITIRDADNIKHLDKNLYINSLILEKKIKHEIENKILPVLVDESQFSSWIRNKIIHHEFIPRIIPSANLLNSSIKLYAPYENFSENTCKQIVKHINEKIVGLIKKQLVPNYFLFSSSYNKLYESYISSAEDSVPLVTFNFFNLYDFDVSAERMNITDEAHVVKWGVNNKDVSYVVLDIPHINILQFQEWISSMNFQNLVNQQYILLFRVPINAEQLSADDQKIKIKQIKSIVEKIEQSKNSVYQLSITGGFSYSMIQEIQKENIHANICTIYTDSNTLNVLYSSLKTNQFIFDEKNENLYKKLLNISDIGEETVIRSFYDRVYKTGLKKHWSDQGLDFYVQKPFKEYLNKIQYNFHCKDNQAIFDCSSLIDAANGESVINKPIFWIGLNPCTNNLSNMNSYQETLKQIHVCDGYDLYNIIHTYLLNSYVPVSFYIDNAYHYNAQNILKDYLFCTNKDSMHLLYQVFISYPDSNNKWGLKVMKLLDLFFCQSKMTSEKKISFITHLCAQYPLFSIFAKSLGWMLLENEEIDELKNSFEKNAKKIVAAVKLKLNFICDKNFFCAGSCDALIEDLEVFFAYFPQLKKPGVLYSDIEREEIIEKFIHTYSNKDIQYKKKKISIKPKDYRLEAGRFIKRVDKID